MEKRRHKRFIISLHAKVISNGRVYHGIIGNVSEEGVASTITTYIKTDHDFSPQKRIELNFQIPSGETVNLNCKIRWFLRPSANDKTLILGLHIIAPPRNYKEWIKKFE